MTSVATRTGAALPSPEFTVVRVDEPMRLQAAARLMNAPRGDAERAERFLRAASAHGIDLGQMWASIGNQRPMPRQVCLTVTGAGKAAMLFTSTPGTPGERRELATVVDRACRDATGVNLIQSLLEPHERAVRAALGLAAFIPVGDLAYLRRPRRLANDPEPGERLDSWPDGVEVRAHDPSLDADLIRALDLSYTDTLDCPELCGLRRTEDVLESHRANGCYEPGLWWLVYRQSRPEGAILLNPNPEQGCIELVYLGLGPGLRGIGLGEALLRWGIAAVAGRSEPFITCAVDRRNEPALRLYRRSGFAEFAARRAMVRRAGPADSC